LARYFANESDFHQHLIDNISTIPVELRGADRAHTFVWAHELTLHDAGVSGGNGSADLLTVDQSGLVWLIEVKFNYSLETGERVWRNQLVRYRSALMSMQWHDIVRYTRKFLLRREKILPQLVHLPDTSSLDRCLAQWLRTLGDDPTRSSKLVADIAEHLRRGSFGVMLISDYFSEADFNEATRFAQAVHAGPVAYAVVQPDHNGFHWQVRYLKTARDNAATMSPLVSGDFRSAVMPLVTPARLLELVSKPSRELVEQVIYPRLRTLGWDDRDYQPKRSSFDALLKIGSTQVPLLVVGTSELDAKSVERAAKIEGGQTLKINPRLKAVLETTSNIEFVNRYMKRFHALGWRGRKRGGKNETWGIVDIPVSEVMASEAAMIYHPEPDRRDHRGRQGDAENLALFFDVFAEMVGEMREN